MALWNRRNGPTAEPGEELAPVEPAAPDPQPAPVAPVAVATSDDAPAVIETLGLDQSVAAGDVATVGGPLEPEELERRRAGLDDLLELMRPAVQMDGGDLALVGVDFEAGIVEVELQGSCGTCAISTTTIKGGIERLMFERLDWVREVRGDVDDSGDPLESAALGRGAYVPRYY